MFKEISSVANEVDKHSSFCICISYNLYFKKFSLQFDI